MESFLEIVRPSSLADIFIYLTFFMTLIMLAVMPEKNEQPQYMLFATVFLCIIDLVRNVPGASATFPLPGFDNRGFGTFLIHITMALLPMIAGGMSRKQGRKGGAVLPIGLLTGLIAGIYAIGSFAAVNAFYDPIL